MSGELWQLCRVAASTLALARGARRSRALSGDSWSPESTGSPESGRGPRRQPQTGPVRRARCAASLALVLSLGASACSGGDDEPAPSVTQAVEVPDQPVDGGTLRLGIVGSPGVDPVEASLGSPSELVVLDLLHDGLTRLDDDGVAQPALAESWTVDEAGTTWEFRFGPDTTYSDGSPVEADDVVASLERVVRPGPASLAALALEPVRGFGDFVGGGERLAGLSAPDATTVRIELTSPLSVLPELLAAPVYGVVDPALADAEADRSTGDVRRTGSWAQVSDEDGTLVLRRRDDRDGHLDEIHLVSFEEAEDAYEAFEDGEVDWALVPPDELEEAVERHGDEHLAPFHAELFFGLNADVDPLRNRPLRQAIAAAIDPEAIVREVYADRADPLSAIVPAGVIGHDVAVCDTCGHDPGRAEALLADVFGDGEVPEVAVDFDDTADQEDMAELIAEQLEEAGIPTTLRPRPLEEYKTFVTSGEQQLFSLGWIGAYASPDAYLHPLLQSAADDNLTGFGTPAVDDRLARARRSPDAAQRQALWADAEAEALEAAVIVPIAQFRTQAVAAPRVQGVRHAVDGTVDWAQVWVTDGG